MYSSQPIKSQRMQIKTFTHDYYIFELPQGKDKISFEKNIKLYNDKLDYKGESIKYAPVARIYGTN